MTVEIYFEDGPPNVAGKIQAHTEAPPTLVWKIPGSMKLDYAAGFGVGMVGGSDPRDATVDIETITFHRERAPHRYGCVCYWADPDARDRAAWEDTMYLDSVEEIGA